MDTYLHSTDLLSLENINFELIVIQHDGQVCPHFHVGHVAWSALVNLIIWHQNRVWRGCITWHWRASRLENKHNYGSELRVWKVVCYQCIKRTNFFLFSLIHEANPQSRPVVIIVLAYVVRSYVRQYVHPSVPTFQNQTNFKRKQCLLMARLWVWPSGSLMTSVLFFLSFLSQKNYWLRHTQLLLEIRFYVLKWSTRPIHTWSVVITINIHIWCQSPIFQIQRNKTDLQCWSYVCLTCSCLFFNILASGLQFTYHFVWVVKVCGASIAECSDITGWATGQITCGSGRVLRAAKLLWRISVSGGV